MAINDPLIGKKLGDYTIESLLGTGGMARVYRGYDDKLARYAAIKIIEPQMIADEAEEEEYRERFLREARSIARLNHLNIVGVYQFNQFENRYYIAMAYIEGNNLRDVLKRAIAGDGLISHTQLLNVLGDIADALDYAHQQGIIHRDVKPSNIIVTLDGRSVLTDFGLALNAVEGTIGNTFGSVHYIAPEQAISSAQAVAQSDQYSLAIIAYEMLTGQVPFDDASAMSVALKHISDPPPPLRDINPDISEEVEAVVMRALDKDFTNRFDTCKTFVETLKAALIESSNGEDTKKNSATAPLLNAKSTTPVSSQIEDEPTIRDTSSRPSDEQIQKALRDKGVKIPSTELSQNGGGSRTGLIVIGVVAALLILGVIVLLFASGLNDDDATSTPTEVVAAQVTEEPTEDATLTEDSEPTVEATEVIIATEEIPTEAIEPTDTATPIPPTATHTEIPTATNTPVPSNTPTPGFEMLDDTDSQVMLRYDGRTLVLFNRDPDNTVNVRRLRFIKFVPDNDGELAQDVSYSATEWDTDALDNLPGLRCLQLFRNSINTLPEGEPPSDMCVSRLRFRSTVDEFWFDTNQSAYFEVRFGEVDQLVTCPVARPGSFSEHRCLVPLP